MKLEILSLWAINDIRDTAVMKKQLDSMKELGFDGVIFHPRRYSGNPEYLSDEYMKIVSEIILYAKKKEMSFWLYDENGWPSGSANGKVISAMPELKCEWLEYSESAVKIKEQHGINSLDKKGVRKFIELTYETYKQKLASEAFAYIKGFFSDEVGFLGGHGACIEHCGIPWKNEIADKYTSEFGKRIYPELERLFSNKQDEFKIWYWEALTELLGKNFYGQIEAWCRANGKLFTAHLKGEEDPFFQVGYSGSCCQILKNISVPGIDALERAAGNPYYLRAASSVSRQFGNGMAMAECMGGAGWGVTPADVKAYTDRLIDCGSNMLVFHINQLHLSYDGITDWPASIPCHEPWRRAFSQLIEKMRERAAEITPADTLLIAPVRGTIRSFAPQLTRRMNEHDGSHQMVCASSSISRGVIDTAQELYAEGVSFDVTDEKIFEENAVFENGGIRIGKCVYTKVIAAYGCELSDKAAELIRRISEPEDQTEWKITPPGENRYLVEIENGSGIIDTEYISDFVLLVSDRSEVILNGTALEYIRNDDHGYYYKPERSLWRHGENTIELSVKNAFVYVLGSFRVLNRKPFYEYDNRQLETENGFYIAPPGVCGTDLILSGYPFCDRPVICKKTVSIPDGSKIKLDCSQLAAAHIYVNGKDCGWLYDGCDTIRTDGGEIRLEVYQSAYNIYGPHHYIRGDVKVVSPMQYSGIKNFADARELPENTKVNEIKLVKWSIPNKLKIIKESDFRENQKDHSSCCFSGNAAFGSAADGCAGGRNGQAV